MADHYTPASIRWSKPQVIWLLRNRASFEVGVYPPDIEDSGYIGGKGKTRKHRAPHETPGMIWGELQLRISKCNQDGYFLEAVYSSEDYLAELDRIARAFHMDIDEVSARVEKALSYCTGICRRWQKCSACRVKNCSRRGKKKAYEYSKYRY